MKKEPLTWYLCPKCYWDTIVEGHLDIVPPCPRCNTELKGMPIKDNRKTKTQPKKKGDTTTTWEGTMEEFVKHFGAQKPIGPMWM